MNAAKQNDYSTENKSLKTYQKNCSKVKRFFLLQNMVKIGLRGNEGVLALFISFINKLGLSHPKIQ